MGKAKFKKLLNRIQSWLQTINADRTIPYMCICKKPKH